MINLKVLNHIQELQGKNIKYIAWSFGNNGSLMTTQENEFLYWELETDSYWDKPTIIYQDSNDLYKMLMDYCDGGENGISDFADELIEYEIFTEEEMKVIINEYKEKERLEDEQRVKQKQQDKLDLYYKLKEELGL